jgi:hypothetical protein
LGKKIDALNNLYAALVDCHFTMKFYGTIPPIALQEFKEKVHPKEEAYSRAKVMASIYLNDEADKIMSAALVAFQQASLAIWLSLPDAQIPAVNKNSYPRETRILDWARFIETYEKAVDCLKNMLNPKVLERIERAR